MNDYPRHLMASLAFRLLQPPTSPLKRALIKQLLPYAFVYVGNEQYLPLNREHKPIGWPCARAAYLDYASEDFASLRVKLHGPSLATNTTRVETAHGEFFYLYGKDMPPPWDSFAAGQRYCGRFMDVLGIEDISEGGAS